MSTPIGTPLFADASLSQFLRQQIEALRPHVEKRMGPDSLASGDEELVVHILVEARVDPLVIDFDRPAKSVSPKRISVRDYDRVIEIDGVRATRTYAYVGDPQLFRYSPSTWSGSVPRGNVVGNSIVVGVEGRNDAEELRATIQKQEELLKEHADWQHSDIDAHNQLLGLLPVRLTPA